MLGVIGKRHFVVPFKPLFLLLVVFHRHRHEIQWDEYLNSFLLFCPYFGSYQLALEQLALWIPCVFAYGIVRTPKCTCVLASAIQTLNGSNLYNKPTVPRSQRLRNPQAHTIIIIAPKSYYYLREWFSLCPIVCDRIDKIVIEHNGRISTAIVLHAHRHCVCATTGLDIDQRLWHSDGFHTKYNLWILIVIAMNYVNGIEKGNESQHSGKWNYYYGARASIVIYYFQCGVEFGALLAFVLFYFFCICLFFHVLFSCTVFHFYFAVACRTRACWYVVCGVSQ